MSEYNLSNPTVDDEERMLRDRLEEKEVYWKLYEKYIQEMKEDDYLKSLEN